MYRSAYQKGFLTVFYSVESRKYIFLVLLTLLIIYILKNKILHAFTIEI